MRLIVNSKKESFIVPEIKNSGGIAYKNNKIKKSGVSRFSKSDKQTFILLSNKQTVMYPLPYNVYQNKKALRGALIFYTTLVFFCTWAMLNSIRKARYTYESDDTGIFLLALIVLIVVIICTWRKMRRDVPVITLEPTGIRFNEKQFKEIGIVEWQDIITCMEVDMQTYMWYYGNGPKYLIIDVKDRGSYAGRIEDVTLRNRFLKRAEKNKALLWVNIASLDTDMVQLKRTVFQMKDKVNSER